MAPRIDPERCPQNHRCPLVRLCPAEAILQHANALPQIDPARCIACGECVVRCGMQAVYQPKQHGQAL